LFVGLEGLLSELLVSTVLDCVHFESVGVGVDEMVLGEDVRNGVEGTNDTEAHHNDHLGVGNLRLGQVRQVLSDIVGHLGGGGRYTVVVLNHTIVKLGRHGDNHVIVVGVEVTTLRNIVTERSCVMIAGEQIVGVVSKTDLMGGDLGELWGPYTLVGVLSLMDGHIGWPDSILDLTLTEVPFLEVVRTILLMSGMDLRKVDHLAHELTLGETFIDEEIILLMHGAVAALAGSGENLESSSQTKKQLVSELIDPTAVDTSTSNNANTIKREDKNDDKKSVVILESKVFNGSGKF
jgi:hypothetical protein